MQAPDILAALPKQAVNLQGRRFGRLVAVSWTRQGRIAWRCACDCGGESLVLVSNLTSGKQKSCGCLAAESRAATHEKQRRSAEHKLLVHRVHSLAYSQSEKGRAARKARYEANKAQRFADVRAWRKANPARVNVHTRNRRAKLRGAEGFHTADDVRAIGERQDWCCTLCTTGIRSLYHVDHIKPVSKGGDNWPSNLQLLCPPCNIRKSDKWEVAA